MFVNTIPPNTIHVWNSLISYDRSPKTDRFFILLFTSTYNGCSWHWQVLNFRNMQDN